MHILLTVNAVWNVWNFRTPIINALLAQGHRVTVLAPEGDSVSNIESLGCRFIPLAMNSKGLNPLEGVKLYRTFKHIFSTEKPDVILSYTIKNNIFGAFAAKSVGIPFIPNVTGLGTAFLSNPVLEAVAGVLYRNAFKGLPIVFFQNTDDIDLFVSKKLIHPTQVRKLSGSGIDLNRFSANEYPSTNRPVVFLMISRLLRDKGVYEFVDAARIFKTQHPETKFQILGAKGAENRSAVSDTKIKEWETEGVIEYLGSTKDVRPYIGNSHCVVLPSYREGAPRTLIEASSMARPVIATKVPGCTAVVEDGLSGLLCEARNVVSLSKAFQEFYQLSNSDKKKMGMLGRKKMEIEFDEKLVISEYIDAINHISSS